MRDGTPLPITGLRATRAGGGAAVVGHVGVDFFRSVLRWILAVGGWYGLDLRIPIPLIDDLFIYLGGECKNALAPRIHSTRGR